MNLKLTLFTLVCLLVQTAGAGTLFVGSGGEGVMINGQLRVRDLADNNLEKTPFFGSTPHRFCQEMATELKNLPEGTDPSRLCLKLNDFDLLYPHLGQYLLEVLLFHRWNFTENPLATLPDNEPISPDSPERVRITIANRYRDQIVLQRQRWLELPSDDRVALLLHEAIYSLLRPICDQELVCRQSPKRARDIVAAGFVSQIRPLTGLAIRDLNLPEGIAEQDHGPSWIELSTWGNQSGSTSVIQTLRTEKVGHSSERTALVAKACENFIAKAGPTGAIELRASRRPYELNFTPYRREQNTQQTAVEIIPRSAVTTRFLSPPAMQTLCVQQIEEILTKWFDCSGGSESDGPFCPNAPPPIPVVTGQNFFNFVARSRAQCERNIRNRLGLTTTCALGGGCGTSCGVPGGSCTSEEPTLWGACIQVSYGSDLVGHTQAQTYNFTAKTASECEDNLMAKLGISHACQVGGGCGEGCGLPGKECASANPTIPGACVQAFFKLQTFAPSPVVATTITGNFVCSSADPAYNNSSVDSWYKDQIISRFRFDLFNSLGRCPDPGGFYYWTGIALGKVMEGKERMRVWAETAMAIDATAPTIELSQATADAQCLSQARVVYGDQHVINAKFIRFSGNQCTVVHD